MANSQARHCGKNVQTKCDRTRGNAMMSLQDDSADQASDAINKAVDETVNAANMARDEATRAANKLTDDAVRVTNQAADARSAAARMSPRK
jgi:hypothetical protein